MLPWLIFTPWKAPPASGCWQAGGRKAGACGRSPCTQIHTHTLLILPLSAPLPLPLIPPHSRPPPVPHPGMAHGSPGTCRGMDALPSASPQGTHERRAAALPRPPFPPLLEKKKRKKRGKRDGKSRIAHPPTPQRGLRLLGGRSELCVRGQRLGREGLAGLEELPCIPPPPKFPFSVAAFLRGSMESSIPLCWERSCQRLPSIRQAGSRSRAPGERCPSHPDCLTAGSSHFCSCLRDTNKKFCNPQGSVTNIRLK